MEHKEICYQVTPGLRVDACRAFWLSFGAILGLLVLATLVICLTVLALGAGIGLALLSDDRITNVYTSGVFTIFGALSAFVLTIFIFRHVGNKMADLIIFSWICWAVTVAGIYLVAAPIHIMGALEYFIFIGMSAGAIAVLVCAIWLAIVLAGKIGSLKNFTAIGGLSGSVWRGWKEKTCVIIRNESSGQSQQK